MASLRCSCIVDPSGSSPIGAGIRSSKVLSWKVSYLCPIQRMPWGKRIMSLLQPATILFCVNTIHVLIGRFYPDAKHSTPNELWTTVLAELAPALHAYQLLGVTTANRAIITAMAVQILSEQRHWLAGAAFLLSKSYSALRANLAAPRTLPSGAAKSAFLLGLVDAHGRDCGGCTCRNRTRYGDYESSVTQQVAPSLTGINRADCRGTVYLRRVAVAHSYLHYFSIRSLNNAESATLPPPHGLSASQSTTPTL